MALGEVWGVIGDAKSISDILRIRNCSFNQKEAMCVLSVVWFVLQKELVAEASDRL